MSFKKSKYIYHISPNKCSLRIDSQPGKFRGPGTSYGGFSAIFPHFGPIFANFEGDIPPDSATGMFIQACRFIWRNTVTTYGIYSAMAILRAVNKFWFSSKPMYNSTILAKHYIEKNTFVNICRQWNLWKEHI